MPIGSTSATRPSIRNRHPFSEKGRYLWPDSSGVPSTAIRWVYVVGMGWITPAELKRRYPDPAKSCDYPVILKYRVDGMALDGIFLPMEVSYWEYKLLEQRTQERLSRK